MAAREEIPLPPPLPLGYPHGVHTSSKPIAADSTGVSMGWRLVWVLLAALFTTGTLWTVFGIATVQNLNEHNTSPQAHSVVLHEGATAVPMGEAVVQHQRVLDAQGKKLEIIATVKIDLDTDRAERLADRAADKIENSARSREVWKTVRDAALENLRARKPIRSGLERYLD